MTHWVHSAFRIDDSGGKYRLFEPADQNHQTRNRTTNSQTRVSARAAALFAARAASPGLAARAASPGLATPLKSRDDKGQPLTFGISPVLTFRLRGALGLVPVQHVALGHR